MKTPQYISGLMIGAYFLVLVLLYKRMSLVSFLVSAGVGSITHSLTGSLVYSSVAAIFVLFAMVALSSKEGFLNSTMPLDSVVAADARKVLNSTYNPNPVEGFRSSSKEISSLVKNMRAIGFKEGFINVAKNVAESLGSGSEPVEKVEGYEDVKAEKNETPAPAKEATEKMTPFKLGEIPTQVKNGPHIDAGSTLMQAIKGLNPDQINAMSKDTQQLIDTQKSLMGMLGTMKPMLNDGKQLMETFQQMFG